MGFFGSSSTPAVTAWKPSSEYDKEAVAAREREKRAARRQRGRSSTILTSGLGLSDQAPVQKKTLLGE